MRAWACGLRRIAADQHAGRGGVGAELGAAGDLVDAVRAQRAGADDLELAGLRHRVADPMAWFSPFSSQRRRPGPRARSCRSRCSGRDCRQARSGSRSPSGWSCARAAPWPRSGSRAYRCRIAGRHAPGTSSAAGCSFSPLAMPSMVPILRPSASAPSTRQEQTRRPSTVTLQAPQSPVPQPSLAPVRPRRSRSTSSSVSSASQRILDGVAVDCRRNANLRHHLLPFARFSAICGRAARQHAGDLDAELLGAALVVDRTAGGRAGGGQLVERRRHPPCVPIRALAASGTSSTWAATAPSD